MGGQLRPAEGLSFIFLRDSRRGLARLEAEAAAVEVVEVGAIPAPATKAGAEPGMLEAPVEVGAMEVEAVVMEPSNRPPEMEGATLAAGAVGKVGIAGPGAGSAGSVMGKRDGPRHKRKKKAAFLIWKN